MGERRQCFDCDDGPCYMNCGPVRKPRFVKGEFKHDEKAGVIGDCHRAAIASALAIPLADVPHFCGDDGDNDEFVRRETEFLAGLGIIPAVVPFLIPDTFTPEDVFDMFAKRSAGACLLLGGTSRNGTNHTVVLKPDGTIWDPTEGDPGIVGPCNDGHYWITFFQHARALCP